jgi:hypothetical protein
MRRSRDTVINKRTRPSEDWAFITRLEVDNGGDLGKSAKQPEVPKELSMDVAGAKALKKRLGPNAADETPPAASADVHEDAPPVYRWTGVSRPGPEAETDDD